MNAPPLLVSFSSIDAFIDALPESARETHGAEIRSLIDKQLPPAVSLRSISTAFGVSSEFIGSLIHATQRHYRIFKIRKGKKTRQIQAPRVALKLIQKWIGFHFANAIEFPPCVHGFIPGKSVLDAARIHCEATWVYSLDIRDFFPSTTDEQVLAAISQLGYSLHGAKVITRLCTLNGHLPQGSPASPVVSNLVFLPFDIALQKIADDLKVRYTRYADDVVFSGQEEPPENLVENVRAIITSGGWVIAEEKEKLCQLPARLKVHGLLVHGTAPRLTKGYRNRIRAYRHLIANEKVKQEDAQKIRGHLAYADFISKSANTN